MLQLDDVAPCNLLHVSPQRSSCASHLEMKWYAAAVTTSLALAGAANASPLSGQTVLKGAMDMAVGGDAPVHAAASWDWYDCGESFASSTDPREGA